MTLGINVAELSAYSVYRSRITIDFQKNKTKTVQKLDLIFQWH